MAGTRTMSEKRARSGRRPLLSTCALAAALVAIGQPRPAGAQSYIGTGAPVSGIQNIDQTVAGQTTVTVSGSTAVINWTPTGTPDASGVIAFQNPGTTARFESISGDYTVINRILPGGANPVSFNGTTESYIGPAGGTIGGNIWFYSPSGIIVGPTGRFDVGSLGLTTLDVTDGGNGDFAFAAAPGSRATIRIDAPDVPTATTISASGTNAYVAMVSPRIDMAGTVNVAGSAAYVAAEAATITIHNGLFDIAVQSGSETDGSPGDAVTLRHTGSTIGAASASAGDPRQIYMVAIPKNNAITMLVGGDVGFDATGASLVDGGITLSAGSNLTTIEGAPAFVLKDSAPVTGFDANIEIMEGHFFSPLTAYALTDISAHTLGVGVPLLFDGSASLFAGRNASLTAANGSTITAGGDLTLRSDMLDSLGAPVAGQATLTVGDGASVTIGGNLLLQANLFGFDLGGASVPLLTGGATSMTVRSGGALAVTGDLSMQANASGTDALSGTAGNGQGGSAVILVDGGTLTVANLSLQTEGFGGMSLGTAAGGNGQGGTARLETANGGVFQAGGDVTLSAAGFGGGDGTDSSTATGTIAGGNGTGGTATIIANGGALTAVAVSISAIGQGASGNSIEDSAILLNGGQGGSGTGGTATLETGGGAINVSTLTINATGTGGDGGDTAEFGYGSGISGDAGAAGNGLGGKAAILASAAGTIDALNTSLDASGLGGRGGASSFAAGSGGGGGTGGGASDMTKGVHIDVSDTSRVTLGSLIATANGDGGRDGFGGTLNAGGTSRGGLIGLTAAGGRIETRDTRLTADGIATANGGDGGRILISIGDAPGSTGALATNNATLTTNSLLRISDETFPGAGLAGQIRVQNNSVDPIGAITLGFGEGGVDFVAESHGTPTSGTPAIEFASSNGPILFLGNASLGSDGDIAFRGNPAGSPAGVDTLFQINGALDLASSGGSLLLRDNADITVAGTAMVRAEQGVDGAGGRLRTGGDADFYLGNGGLTLGTLDIGGTLNELDATGALIQTNGLTAVGAIDIADTLSIAGGGAVLQGAAITIGKLYTAGDTFLYASGDINVTTDIGVGGLFGTSGANVSLRAQNALALYFAYANSGDVAITAGQLYVDSAAGSGNVSLTTLDQTGRGGASITAGVVNAGGNILIDSAQDVTLTDTAYVNANDSITIKARNEVRADAGSLVGQGFSSDSSSTDMPMDAPMAGVPAKSVSIDADSILLDGVVNGGTIALRSATIGIGTGATIGGDRTQALTFTNIRGQTGIGGAGSSSGYSLSNAEIARTRANQIEIVAPAQTASGSGSGSDTVIDTLSLFGTAASNPGNLVGDNAAFRVRSDGNVRVVGAVTLLSAGSGDTFAISAGQRLDVVTPTGSIGVFGQGGALGGRILLDADTITVASQQAIADLATLPTIGAKSDRLGTNDGPTRPDGYIQANALEFSAGAGLFIQNSGGISSSAPSSDAPSTSGGADPATRAGFTAGPGGVTIVTRPPSGGVTQIAINGRQSGSAGASVTGADLIPLLTIRGSASGTQAPFDPRSTVNGCLIVSANCQPDSGRQIPPVQDVIGALLTPPDDSDPSGDAPGTIQRMTAPLVEFAEFTGFGFAPVIEDPVTGAGNDQFWSGPGGANDDPGGNVDQQITGTRRDDDEQGGDATPR
jgi:hypothetical protein